MKHVELKIDVGILRTINELYIDSRYPGELGLLPNGNPTKEDAEKFFNIAKKVYDDVNAMLKDEVQGDY